MLRELLASVGLQTWVKSSGSSGVQVYALLNVPIGFDATKA